LRPRATVPVSDLVWVRDHDPSIGTSWQGDCKVAGGVLRPRVAMAGKRRNTRATACPTMCQIAAWTRNEPR